MKKKGNGLVDEHEEKWKGRKEGRRHVGRL